MTENLHSPFSSFHSYEVKWGKMGKWREEIGEIRWTPEEEMAITYLKRCNVMTSTQLIQGVWNGNKKGRKYLNRMAGYGIIDEHRLLRNKEIEKDRWIQNEIIYYTPRWVSKKESKIKLEILLQRFVFIQLFLKLKEKRNVDLMPALPPYAGGLLTQSDLIFVAVNKKNTTQLQDAFKQNKSNRMIVIIEKESHITNLKPYIQVPTQFILETTLTLEKSHILTKNRVDATL
jgi:hypothetical protein